jgi:hypothetical protein
MILNASSAEFVSFCPRRAGFLAPALFILSLPCRENFGQRLAASVLLWRCVNAK